MATATTDGTGGDATPPESIQTPTDTTTAAESPKPTKLHGRAFYESIGSPKFVLAPMVDQSEFAWRMLTRTYMTPSSTKDLLAYTPMLHARLFTTTEKFRFNHFQPTRSGLPTVPTSAPPAESTDTYLDGHPSIDRPLFVQFCANTPEDLLAAAQYVAPFCDAVDLNLGCPQGIARKGGYGAFLQEDQELIYKLINTLHTGLDVPEAAKIRVLEPREEAQRLRRRLREAEGHKTGLADWAAIRHLRDNLPKETVIFANGNILSRGDIERCLEATGADAVMSAEGNLYDPAIFAEAPEVGEEGCMYWRGRDGKGGFRMDEALRRYLDILYKYVLEQAPPARKPLYIPGQAAAGARDPPTPEADDEPPRTRARTDAEPAEATVVKTATEAQPTATSTTQTPDKKQKNANKKQKREKTSSPNLLAMQPHCFHLLRALVSKHDSVRDALARSRPGDMEAYEGVLAMGGKAVEYETSVKAVRECRRPFWVCQPYVRPLPMEAMSRGSVTMSKKELAKLKEGEKEVVMGMGARRNDERQNGGVKQGEEKKEEKMEEKKEL
ncbi:hypothetical protein VE04_09423 [Pseudogymnoascus sp. 24MN13]|nr:hypothetical protein VE04_09423 [Pseudogymnoascus sp. 24MN13]